MQMDDQTTFAQVGIVTAIDTDNYRVKVWFPLLEKESEPVCRRWLGHCSTAARRAGGACGICQW